MLDIVNLTCLRDERLLFSHLNITISAGDIVQVEGANGAGKTSLLLLLAGLSQPEIGNVLWQQRDIRDQRPQWQTELLFIGHQPGVKGVLTPLENLAFWHPACDEKARLHVLERVGLSGYGDQRVSRLSVGQQRRVALARLWLSRSTVWILDEPFTAIDKAGVSQLMQLFVQHSDQGGIVIMTTHQDLPVGYSALRRVKLSHAGVTTCCGA